ncbi:MAG TPA: hypothetical protein VF198_11330 [Vicinamibacterales bacterium]
MRSGFCLFLAVWLAGAMPRGEPAVELGTPDEALRELFTPASAPPGTYRVFRSTEPARELATRLKGLDPNPAPGAWEPRRLEIGAVFGYAGQFDPGRLGRLFRGRRVEVIRGSLHQDGRHRAFVLISPYPDPGLSRIVDGTMTIVIELTP